MGMLNWTISFCLQRCVFGGVYFSSFNKVSEDMRAALRFASAAGALTCTRKGAIAAQPSIDDIVTLLSNKNNNSI